MSRIQIALTNNDRIDPHAFIGYDRPLRTFFLQGFLHDVEDYEDFEIWLGTDFDEFPTLDGIIEEAKLKGYIVGAIQQSDKISLLLEASQPSEPSLFERIGFFDK